MCIYWGEKVFWVHLMQLIHPSLHSRWVSARGRQGGAWVSCATVHIWVRQIAEWCILEHDVTNSCVFISYQFVTARHISGTAFSRTALKRFYIQVICWRFAENVLERYWLNFMVTFTILIVLGHTETCSVYVVTINDINGLDERVTTLNFILPACLTQNTAIVVYTLPVFK